MRDPFADMTPDEAQRFMSKKQNIELRTEMAYLVGTRNLYDLGCGKGILVNMLYTPEQYVGVDVSEELLRIARKDNPGYRFIRHDLAASPLPVDDQSAEVGVMISVLEHQPSLEIAKTVYDEAMRTCKELLVLWHTPPIYKETEIIEVPCELDMPINQNHYARGSFEREDLQVRAIRVAGFECWRVSRR